MKSVPGHLADDGVRVQCHECGQWYKTLGTHVQSAHGISAPEYRKAWGLPPRAPLSSEEQRKLSRSSALLRLDKQGAIPGGRFTGGINPSEFSDRDVYDEAAENYWEDKLREAGWSSWNEAVEWMNASYLTWHELAARLKVRPNAVSRQAELEGLGKRSRYEEMLPAADAHFAEHGTLVNTRGDLAEGLAKLRTLVAKGKPAPALVVKYLDRLDPQWRLGRTERRDAAGRRGVLTARQKSDIARLQETIEEAGFSDAVEMVGFAIVNHLHPRELGAFINADGQYVFTRLRRNAEIDPFEANRHLMLSRPGHLEDDGSRMQCHECGLWIPELRMHVVVHKVDGQPLTEDAYRRRHDLEPDLPLVTVGPKRERRKAAGR